MTELAELPNALLEHVVGGAASSPKPPAKPKERSPRGGSADAKQDKDGGTSWADLAAHGINTFTRWMQGK